MNKQSITKILFTILISMMGANAFAYDIAVDNADGVTIYYNYINAGKELEVTYMEKDSYGIVSSNYKGDINIPEEVSYMNRTRKVTSIGEKSFYYCSSVTSLSIPNSVTSIGEFAFYGCRGLTSVTLGSSLTSIGRYAFCDCRGLTSIEIPNSLMTIDMGAFELCTSLTSFSVDEANTFFKSLNGVLMSKDGTILVVYPNGRIETTYVIPNSVTSIGDGAFSFCSALTSVTIPNSVTSIGVHAFQDCTSLASIEIPNSVTSIDGYAFNYCKSLASITIPNSVTSIGGYAFGECNGLKKVIVSDIAAWCGVEFGIGANPLSYARHLYSDEKTEIKDLVIPNSVTSIGGAFSGCSCLTSVTIPNSVTRIGESAFSGCSGLTSITIPNSVTSLGDGAFSGCYGLTSINIPNSVTSIDRFAFANCYGLTSINISNNVTSIGMSAFSGCSGLTSVTVPNSVTSISESAFERCSGLTSVTIGSNVTSIGQQAFYDCDIQEVISKIEKPFGIAINAFSNNTFKNATLYVPIGTIDKYKTKNGWREFFFIEEGVPSGVEQPFSKTRQIQSEDGVLKIQNIKNGTPISVYNANGTFVGSTISQNEKAIIDTNMQLGSVAIVKIGEQSVKVIIK